MMNPIFPDIEATAAEKAASLPGDDIVPVADVAMDTAFTLPVPVHTVWPWLLQLGKDRSGWYFSHRAGRFILPGRRGLRHIDPSLQTLKIGDVITDWGGKDATFEAIHINPPHSLVYKSHRGRTHISWAIVLEPTLQLNTRVHFRLRLAPVRFRWLARTGGSFIDKLTISWLAAGLKERVVRPEQKRNT